MQDGIVIEQMKLSEKDSVLAFLKTAYSDNPRQSNSEFWNWHFVEPPYSEPHNLPVWLAKSGERIAGHLAAIPVELNVGAEAIRAIWILDLIVDPDFRRKGIGKKLVLAAERFCPFLLGVNTDQQHAPALLMGLDWVIVSKIPRYQKILFPGNAIREISRIKTLRNIVNGMFLPFRPRIKRDSLNEFDLRVVEKIDSSFDDLWKEAREQWNCSVSRNSAMVDWQFKQQPDKKSDILGCYEDDKLLGYAILFFRKKTSEGIVEKAAISDFCYHPSKPGKIIDSLLQGALQIALDRRAGGLVVDALDPLLGERLRHFGFWKINSALQLMAKASKSQDLLYDASKWFLTRGDSDISIFERPNL